MLILIAKIELALIREALNVGPEDQSLWYYHQFLILNLAPPTPTTKTMAPGLSTAERATYISLEIAAVKDLLEDYADIKWVFEALVECTLALAQLEGRAPTAEEKVDLEAWVVQLRALDPMRRGRWDDLEKELGLSKS